MIGFFCVNKPVDISSAGVVAKIKGITNAKKGGFKVGHFGTLDPLASGVLPIAVGKATRLFDFAVNKKKKYVAEFTFGQTTDTLDRGGVITEKSSVIPSKDAVLTALEHFVGELDQLPPDYSAKSIGGVRAYKMARSGQTVTLSPKKVTVYAFSLLQQINDKVFTFEIECGGGTYIRALARDLAARLDTVGYMSNLMRTESGVFTLENSATIEDIQQDYSKFLLPVSLPIKHLPRYDLEPELLSKVLNGVKIQQNDFPNGNFTLYCNDKLLGVASSQQNILTLECNLYDERI